MATDEQVDQEQFIQRQSIDDPPDALPDPTDPPVDEKYSDEHLFKGMFTQYANDISYFTDEGLRVIMTAGAPGSTDPDGNPVIHEIVRVGLPITTMVVTGTCERTNAWPKIPHWDVKNDDIICLSHRIQLGNPHQVSQESQIYRVSWEYTYRLLKPITDTMQLPAGTSPFEKELSGVHYFDQDENLDDLLNDMSFLSL